MSQLRVNSITNAGGTGPAYESGSVVQIVSKTFSDVTSMSNLQAYVDVTNGDVSITSKFANSKFLIIISAQGYVGNGDGANIGINRVIGGNTVRVLGPDGGGGDSWMGINHGGDTAISWNAARQHVDSPLVSSGTTITYKLMMGHWTGTTAVWLNYAGYTGGSTITVMEIAA